MSNLYIDYDLACRQEQYLKSLIPEFDLLTNRDILEFFMAENVDLSEMLWDVSCTAFMIETIVHCSWNRKSEQIGRNIFFDLADCFLAARGDKS